MSDNPFLLPPGGAKPSASPPAASPPAASPTSPTAPSGDPSHYIAVPASVESATHRIARPAQGPSAPPATESATEPGTEPAIAETPVEDTRVAAPPRWAFVLPDGARVALDAPVLLGRDPAGIPQRPGATLLPVADDGKTVSKTHALLEPSPEGVRVHDLHSTNGVAIDTAAGRQLVTPGGEAVAPSGATVMLGSFAIRIEG